MTKYNSNCILLFVIIGAVIFFLFIMPEIDKNYLNEQKLIKENFYAKFNNVNTELIKIDTEKCSRNCCGLAQWPVPSEMLDNSISPDELKNYIPSNFSCNFGSNSGSGCVCLTQKNNDYLTNRGNI